MNKVRYAGVTVIFLFTTVLAFGQKASDNFAGKWKAEEGVIITISNVNGKWIGLDPKNRQTLYNMRFKKGEWKATPTNNEENITASCKVYFQGNRITIVAHNSIFSKTIIWNKI